MRLLLMLLISVSIHLSAQNFEYVKQLKGNSKEVAVDIKVDKQGNTFIGGFFNNVADFDPGSGIQNRTSNGFEDCFILKLDDQGDFVWVKTFGGSGKERLYGLAIDKNGDVYATGGFNNTVDFDPSSAVESKTSNGDYDVFIVKFDSQGNFNHVTTVGGSNRDVGESIVVDSSLNMVVCGSFQDTVDFNPGSGIFEFKARRVGSFFLSDGFALILNSNQKFRWAKQSSNQSSPSNRNHITYDVEVSELQNVYILNSRDDAGSININKSTINGLELWSADINSFRIRSLEVFNMVVDKNEDVIIVGGVRDPVDFDASSDTAFIRPKCPNIYQGFICKYSKNGDFLWVRSFECLDRFSSKQNTIYDVSTDLKNNILVSGYYNGRYDFDSGIDSTIYTSKGNSSNPNNLFKEDIFIASYNESGNYLWAHSLGSFERDVGLSIESSGEYIHAVGYFSDTVDFNPSPNSRSQLINYLGETDAYILKWKNCSPSFNQINITACNDYYLPSGKLITSSGVFKDTISNSVGCDSIVTANITINSLDTSISRFGDRLIANADSGFYQWIDCNNNYQPISGEIGRTFTPSSDGSFAVIILKNNCKDTSSCYVATVGLNEKKLLNSITVYPNPTNKYVNLSFTKVHRSLNVQVLDLNGEVLLENRYKNSAFISFSLEGANGIYIVKITSEEGTSAFLKVLKNK